MLQTTVVVKERGKYGEGNYHIYFVLWQGSISNSHPQMHLNIGAFVKMLCNLILSTIPSTDFMYLLSL